MRKRSLNAAEDFEPFAIPDLQRMLAGLIVVTAAFDDLETAKDAPVFQVPLQPDHRVGKKFRRFRCRMHLGVGSDLVREHRGQMLTVQPFD